MRYRYEPRVKHRLCSVSALLLYTLQNTLRISRNVLQTENWDLKLNAASVSPTSEIRTNSISVILLAVQSLDDVRWFTVVIYVHLSFSITPGH